MMSDTDVRKTLDIKPKERLEQNPFIDGRNSPSQTPSNMGETISLDDYTTLPGKSGATHSISLCLATLLPSIVEGDLFSRQGPHATHASVLTVPENSLRPGALGRRSCTPRRRRG